MFCVSLEVPRLATSNEYTYQCFLVEKSPLYAAMFNKHNNDIPVHRLTKEGHSDQPLLTVHDLDLWGLCIDKVWSHLHMPKSRSESMQVCINEWLTAGKWDANVTSFC